jgi:hypothetical protein
MPYEIRDEGAFLFTRFSGVLTEDDLLAAIAEIARIEDASSTSKDRITDLTGLEDIRIGFTEMLMLANQRRKRTFTAPVKSALIAHRSLHVGYARMFQTLNEHPQMAVRIVGSREEAVRWFDGK